jgi:membrane-bound metal-dependent hydrolase YbcI (DUF457 family)
MINTNHKRNYDNAGHEKHVLLGLCITFLGTTLHTRNNFSKKKAMALYTCYLPAFPHIFSPIQHPVLLLDENRDK